MLPDNVLRPTPADLEPAWGDRIPPGRFGGQALEVGQRLGLTRLGACLLTLPPGKAACPLHYHAMEEEAFYALDGPVTRRELGPGEDPYAEYLLQPGELAMYPPGTGLAHQSINRTDTPIRYLALSSAREPGEVCVYPDSGKTMVRGIGVGVFGAPVQATLAAAHAAAQNRPSRWTFPAQRPAHVQGPDRVPERDLGGGAFGRQLARAAGATQVFINVDRLTPGARSSPLHWHTQNEELVLVLAGHPVLRQVADGEESTVALQPGDFAAFRPGAAVGHQFLAQDDEVQLLVIGTDRLDDVTMFPERDQVHVRALGQTGTLHKTDYFAGED